MDERGFACAEGKGNGFYLVQESIGGCEVEGRNAGENTEGNEPLSVYLIPEMEASS